MKNKNKLFYPLFLSLLVNVIFLAASSSGSGSHSLSASLSGMFGFSPPEVTELKDYKKPVVPCYLNGTVYVPYSTFSQDGGFITKAAIDAAMAEDSKANGISYYYAVDQSTSNPMFGGRMFVVFKSNQKTVVAGRTTIVNLNTTYHNTDMTCPMDCPVQ